MNWWNRINGFTERRISERGSEIAQNIRESTVFEREQDRSSKEIRNDRSKESE